MTRSLLALSLLLTFPLFGQQSAKKPFDAFALSRLVRVSDPQLSPDGSTVAFVAERVYLSDNNRQKHIYTVPLAGGEPRRITLYGESNTRPRWAPDSQRIAFVSGRSGKSQIWIMNADGTGAQQVTDLATEADGVLFSPNGGYLLFTSRVFPECDNAACNEQKLKERENSGVEARIYDTLLYRHWNQWDDGRRSHLFAVNLEGPGAEGSAFGTPRDLTPGNYDVPPFSLGGPDAYAIAPDGQEICFERGPGQDPASSTNLDLFVVSPEGGAPTQITTNLAADASPVYSPDGRYLAYRAQERPGYESDRWRLTLLTRATGELVNLTETLDRWVTSITWSSDSARLFFTAEDRGREPIMMVPATGGGVKMIVFGDAHHGDIQFAPDGRSIVYTGHSGSHPTEIFRGVSSGGAPAQLTHFNDEMLNEYRLDELEQVSYRSSDGATVEGFLAKPPNFDMQKKYPLLLLIHGGPQGAWGESWSYRWNPQVFAAAGFVVFMPNPRGSTGYGQSFIDAIRGDWGGQAYLDIMAGVDHVSRRPYVDSGRMAAAGASYGGYMINWMLGHTDRFRAFVSHAGVYDLESMFGATEELWFPLWEFHGTPWDNPEMYERWSPSKYVANFKTPTMVVHGEKDYRVPSTQGMQLFTALQSRGIPSRFLYFPDEGHWILKPRNSLYWHQSVIDWLKSWVDRGYAPAPTPAPISNLDQPPDSVAEQPKPAIQIDRGPQP
ncbi:MAG: S9 family peptidase [Bryobacterales bacterium]